jgi:dUTP pyrophosphatase
VPKIVWERLRPRAVIPAPKHEGDAGADLVCAEGVSLEPWEFRDIPVGLRAAVPTGYYARITGRSSTIRVRGMEVHEGIIDEGYRGEWFVAVTNRNPHPVSVEEGDRLGQVILCRLEVIESEEGIVDVAATSRGADGFGSTGLKHG